MCSTTPRFSYGTSETAICACPTGPVDVGSAINSGCTGWGMVPGGYTGWVYRGCIPGYYPSTAQGGPSDSEAGPGSLREAGVGGHWGRVRVPGYGGRDGHSPTLRARSVPCWALPREYPWNAHLGPIWRELRSKPVKLVKTTKCHQNNVKRPPIVPISKTGSESQLLKFSDFHFWQPSLPRN